MAAVLQHCVSQGGTDVHDVGEEGKVQGGLEKYPLEGYLNQEASGLVYFINTVR